MSVDTTVGVRRIADDYLEAKAALDPEAAAILGRRGGNLIPDLSPEAFGARAELDRRTAADLRACLLRGDAVPGTADHRLATAMIERLTSDVDLYDAGFTTTLLAPLATPVHAMRQVFDDLPTGTDDDWAVIAETLESVPRELAAYTRTLEQALDQGRRFAPRQALGLAQQCREWVDPDGTDFYRSLVARHDGALQSRLDAAALAAGAATEAFAHYLVDDLAPRATAPDGVGRDLYEVTSRAFLGTSVDLDELYAYGWAELRRLDSEARELAREITGESDLDAALAMLDDDPAGRVDVGPPLVAWLQGRIDRVAERINGPHVDIPAHTAPVEARMVTAGAGVMYYAAPDPALTRPGRVWWSVPAGVTSVPTWREVSTVHHEGLPGHHLQFAITLGLDDLHPWQRHLCHVHGYAEGWAHYAEQLSVELGLLDDPRERLGMLYAQLWRAARIVIDIGLHLSIPIPAGNGFTDETAWTPEIGADFLHRVAGVDPQTARFEVARYLGWPGQALAFKAGARLWQQARAEDERRLGAAFDLKHFHMTALGLGPMGLGPLKQLLLDESRSTTNGDGHE
jgi:uncharacterized protein (DUF885 family)